jgi:cytoskeletal protein RodZ
MQPLQQQVPSNNPLLSQAYLQQLQQQQPSQAWQQQPNAWWPAQGVATAAASVPQYAVTAPNSNSAQGAQGYSAANLGGMPWRPR